MPKITKIFAIAAAVASLSFSSAAPASDNQVDAPSIQHTSGPTNLFVIDVNDGKLTHISGRIYQLRLPLSEITSVLKFTDRPYRQASRVAPNAYAQSIHQGPDSYDIDPPNLALSWGNEDTLSTAYTVDSVKKGSRYITYTLKNMLNESAKEQSGKVSLFIDSQGKLVSTCKRCQFLFWSWECDCTYYNS